eukprot:TRINITY_DN3192_c0_g1::TRINITY_DN3192_c0_g1_i1::g.3542::m.3542 TRINITY_DN3192_c0_g1::TRINITY_DN3192_c0_g1_i1::g.3542  ORF type:complete len:549 (+),score=71.55 TRINITY_DN3192_c0_g1_i1:96-1742(+)
MDYNSPTSNSNGNDSYASYGSYTPRLNGPTLSRNISSTSMEGSNSRPKSAPPRSRPGSEKGSGNTTPRSSVQRSLLLYEKAIEQQLKSEYERTAVYKAEIDATQSKTKKLSAEQQAASIERLATPATDKLIRTREKIMEEERQKMEKTKFVKPKSMVEFMKAVTSTGEKPEERLWRMEEARQEKLNRMREEKDKKEKKEVEQYRRRTQKVLPKGKLENLLGRLTQPPKSVSREASTESVHKEHSIVLTPEQIMESVERLNRLNEERERKLQELQHMYNQQKMEEIERTRVVSSSPRKLNRHQTSNLLERLTRKDEMTEQWISQQKQAKEEAEKAEHRDRPEISEVSKRLAAKRRSGSSAASISGSRVSLQQSTDELYTAPSDFDKFSRSTSVTRSTSVSRSRAGSRDTSPAPSMRSSMDRPTVGMNSPSLVSLSKQELVRRIEQERQAARLAQQTLARVKRELEEQLRQEREFRMQAETAVTQLLQEKNSGKGGNMSISGMGSATQVLELQRELEKERDLRRDAEARAELLQEECMKLYQHMDPEFSK